MASSGHLLKTQQVAEALGVSVSTIKRWVDSGALQASRTVGKHRLIELGEALRFAREQELPRTRLEALLGMDGPRPEDLGQALESLVTALKRGRASEARSLIEGAYAAAKSASALADEVIRPAMERLGHDWESGSLDIYQEHRASRIVEMGVAGLISRFASSPVGPGAPLAIGATPSGDLYTLSGLLCELALRELGWEVSNLGPNLPLSSLGTAVRAQRPKLVWLSVHHLADPEGFVREYSAFYRAAASVGAAVCLGGAALDAPLRSRLLAAGFGDRVAHLVEFARRLVPTGAPTSPPGPSGRGL